MDRRAGGVPRIVVGRIARREVVGFIMKVLRLPLYQDFRPDNRNGFEIPRGTA